MELGDPRPGLNLSHLSDTLSVSLESPFPLCLFSGSWTEQGGGSGEAFPPPGFPQHWAHPSVMPVITPMDYVFPAWEILSLAGTLVGTQDPA